MTKVLIIEPDAPLMRVMGWVLKDAAFEVVGEQDFERALRTLPELRPDVTVLDGDATSDGKRADRIAALRTRWPSGRVVDLQQLPAQHAPAATTADLMLAKPFQAESLVAAVQRLSAEREPRAQPMPSRRTTATNRPEDS